MRCVLRGTPCPRLSWWHSECSVPSGLDFKAAGGSIVALRASRHCKHDMDTLSWLNVPTLEIVPTSLFGSLVRCSTHGHSFARVWYVHRPPQLFLVERDGGGQFEQKKGRRVGLSLPFLTATFPFHTVFSNQSLYDTHSISLLPPLLILTIVSPSWVPRIGYQPVWGAILSAPAKNLDGMPSEQ